MELAVELGVPLATGSLPDSYPSASLLHPKRRFGVYLGGTLIGAAGEIHPGVLKRYKIKRARPCYFELQSEGLLTGGKRPSFVEPPSYHPVIRSLAFTLPHGVEAGDILAKMLEDAPKSLSSAGITDEYRHEDKGETLRTITYQLVFANPDFSITAEEVNSLAEALIAKIDDCFGNQGVSLR
jgi:phenylalanyl-tRNA synthetase beta chain